jgi:hypothetical protein
MGGVTYSTYEFNAQEKAFQLPAKKGGGSDEFASQLVALSQKAIDDWELFGDFGILLRLNPVLCAILSLSSASLSKDDVYNAVVEALDNHHQKLIKCRIEKCKDYIQAFGNGRRIDSPSVISLRNELHEDLIYLMVHGIEPERKTFQFFEEESAINQWHRLIVISNLTSAWRSLEVLQGENFPQTPEIMTRVESFIDSFLNNYNRVTCCSSKVMQKSDTVWVHHLNNGIGWVVSFSSEGSVVQTLAIRNYCELSANMAEFLSRVCEGLGSPVRYTCRESITKRKSFMEDDITRCQIFRV